MGVPLEWNVFMIFGVLSLFVAHASLGLGDSRHPVVVAILFVVIAGIVVLGNMFPRKVSFLPGMRYYAGNWDTTLWCIKPSAEDKINRGIVAIASMPQAQRERFYGSPEAAQIPIYMGYAFRGFNTHGRALFTLAHRAMAGQNEDDYVITDGERICSTAIGWNFGDGHMHNEQLIAALQKRCHFEPEECGWSCSTRSRSTSRHRSTGWWTRQPGSSSAAWSRSPTGDPAAPADDVPVQVLSDEAPTGGHRPPVGDTPE